MRLKFVEQIEAREAARIVTSANEPLGFRQMQSRSIILNYIQGMHSVFIYFLRFLCSLLIA